MTLFIILASIMVIAALGIMLPPLLRGRKALAEIDREKQNLAVARDNLAELEASRAAGRIPESQYQEMRAEMESLLATELDQENGSETSVNRVGRWMVLPVGLAVPLLSGWLYWQLGNPVILDPELASMAEAASSQQASMDPQEMVARLEAKMEQDPDNIEGWLMLGRSYKYLKRYQDAVTALKTALDKVGGEQPDIMLQYADALAMAQGGTLQGEPARLIERALELAPEHMTALWLAGMVAADEGNFQLALERWRKAEPMMSDDPESQATLREFIVQAEQRIAENTGEIANSAGTVQQEQSVPAGTSISVSVALDDAWLEKVSPDDSVFIFAQAVSGPPMPLAVARRRVSDLPVTVQLDDSMAMTPQLKLSSFKEVNIVARVSRTGQAIPQPGDIQGKVSAVAVASGETIDVQIDTFLQ